jgi:hypothetical protein
MRRDAESRAARAATPWLILAASVIQACAAARAPQTMSEPRANAAPSVPCTVAPDAPVPAAVEPAEGGPSGAAGHAREDEAGATDVELAMSEALSARWVFRQIVTGIVQNHATRLTWTLRRDARNAELRLFCQRAGGMRLDGQEGDEARWGTPASGRFEGARALEGVPMRLAAKSDLTALRACTAVAQTLLVTCRKGHVAVHRAGAVLGRKGAHGEWGFQPAATETVASLECLLAADRGDPKIVEEGLADQPVRAAWASWALEFAEPRSGAPGIEWAHENSDQVVQMGAYRWIPAAP